MLDGAELENGSRVIDMAAGDGGQSVAAVGRTVMRVPLLPL